MRYHHIALRRPCLASARIHFDLDAKDRPSVARQSRAIPTDTPSTLYNPPAYLTYLVVAGFSFVDAYRYSIFSPPLTACEFSKPAAGTLVVAHLAYTAAVCGNPTLTSSTSTCQPVIPSASASAHRAEPTTSIQPHQPHLRPALVAIVLITTSSERRVQNRTSRQSSRISTSLFGTVADCFILGRGEPQWNSLVRH